MEQKEVQIMVLVVTIIIIVLAASVVIFFSYFQKKKIAYILKQREIQQRFEEEINKSKLEIQEQSLQHISWEIHDNVGQLLSVAKMQLNMIQYSLPTEQQSSIIETSEIVGKSLQELRDLAKSLNPEKIKNLGLIESVKNEFNRYKRLNFLVTELTIEGDEYSLNNKKEIILFRIIQEFCNNTMKYAKAKNLKAKLVFNSKDLLIKIEDDGIGFNVADESTNQKGIGLLNMKSRAELINAKFKLTSQENVGTKLYISCPK
jgi:signal transduction histidine kinase